MAEGMDLKVARVRERVLQREVGKAMGVSQVRVANIEATAFVRKDLVERYMKALEEVKASR